MDTKSVSFPYLPELDEYVGTNDLDTAINVLDTKGHRLIIDHANWETKYPYKPLTAVAVAHSGSSLFLDFFVRCNYMRAVNTVDQSAVSEDSCVEFFVSPTADNHYWNFEFNCIGTINASHRSERHNPVRLTSDELARVIRYPSCGKRPFCELEGLFTWNLLAVIPLDLIGTKFDDRPIEMKANFYKCASATSSPHYLSWNPVTTENPDFHRPEFFGNIILEGK